MTHVADEQAMQVALQHHRAGRLQQAEVLYRQILARQPRHAPAMHHLGLIARQVGRLDIALDLIARAVALEPAAPEAHSNLGNALKDSGRLDDAIAAYRRAISLYPDFADAFNNLGNALRDKGQLDEAIAAYRRAVTLKPDYAEAHCNLGNALKDKGQLDEAIAACRQAIALRPEYAEAHINLGHALKAKGQLDDAIVAYRRSITQSPNYADAHNNLGHALIDAGRLDEAIAAYRQAITLKPDDPCAHNYLGSALQGNGQLEEAAAQYRQAIALDPTRPDAYSSLGNVLREQGQFDQAIAACRRAITISPTHPEACCNLGNALKDGGQLNDAIAAYEQAISLKPDFPEAHNNLGNVLISKNQLDEAIAAYRRAIALRPGYAEARSNLDNALNDLGQFDESIASYRQAISLMPSYPQAHFNLALRLLARGDFQQGWEEHEWRWKCRDFSSPARNFAQPQWDGSPLQGRTILLHAEQSFGDTIQFIRYVPLVAQRGGRIIIECQAELQPLVGMRASGHTVILPGQPLPAFDLHCPLLSLPRAFKTTLGSVPAETPYLFADPNLIESWRQKMTDSTDGLRVGLAWAGNTRFKGDRTRSISLDRLAPLAKVRDVTFYSLQKGDAAKQVNNVPTGLRLVDLSPELHDFADTAAVMCLLDLVITTDTSVAHLAGALGRPVWVMLQFVPDWRWHLAREDSHWYPTMRLFRQPSRGDWDSVITRVAGELSLWVKRRDLKPPAMIDPSIREALGQALHHHQAGRLADAERLYRQVLAREPEHADALHYLGVIANQAGLNDAAESLIRRAIARRPDYAEAYCNLGGALEDKGQLDEAMAAYRQAIALAPRMAVACRQWERMHALPLTRSVPASSTASGRTHDNDPCPDRRLRIGYVSPNFADHVVGRNLLPLFRHHDRRQFEITCYSQVLRPDSITAEFQQGADRWRNIVGFSDEQVAGLIKDDQTDLLVDLTLHLAHNRLLVFARKPAPVQATFAGYPGSTGLSAIDYRLSDPYLDPIAGSQGGPIDAAQGGPPGVDEWVYSERTVRLPDSFWCYDPLDCREIPVNPLPALEAGVVTFGCLNNFCKINEGVLSIWAQALRQVEGSRLLLLAREGSHRQRTMDQLRQNGVGPERVEFAVSQPRREYLKTYHRIDLGLDSFPYNGHTTSLDSFWMGVPVVTLAGKTAVSRAGWCQASNLGLAELAGQDSGHFVRIAVELARDLPRLKELRATLRQRMEQSPLMDAPRFARNVEAAFRRMWRNWCGCDPR